MSPGDAEESARLKRWLALLSGDGYRGKAARDAAVAEMCAAGPGRLFPLLLPMLEDPDAEVRCAAAQAVLWIDPGTGLAPVLRLLHDPDSTVRWNTCGLLHDFGDGRAVAPLSERLEADPDPQVRGIAAYALGGIGSPRAIPALVKALDGDHAVDPLGYTPSFCAAHALDDILGTNVMRECDAPSCSDDPTWLEQVALNKAADGARVRGDQAANRAWLRARALEAYGRWAGAVGPLQAGVDQVGRDRP
jgi:HEAT repeat protein